MPQEEFTTFDAKAARHVGKFMTEVAAAQLFRDNGMNIWHGVTPSSMSAFFQCEQERDGSKLESAVPNRHSVNRWAKRWRARWGTRRKTLCQGARRNPEILKREAGAFFLHIAVPFLGSKSGPKTGSTNLPSNYNGQKSLTPFLGPKTRLVLFRGPACCNLIFALSGDSFLADGSLRGCQVCRQGGVVFERGGNLACKSI